MDAAAMEAIRTAANEAATMAGLHFTVRSNDVPFEEDAGPRLFMHVLPIANAAEEVDQPNGDGALTFDSLARVRRKSIVLHEMLHYVGVKKHSPIATEVMCGDGGCDPNRWPSPRERAVVAWLMSQPNGQNICQPNWRHDKWDTWNSWCQPNGQNVCHPYWRPDKWDTWNSW
jgi:hypothetical protein